MYKRDGDDYTHGHSVVSDGYGYSGDYMYLHINVGYSRKDWNIWYNMFGEAVVEGSHEWDYVWTSIVNIHPTVAGHVVSGRVLSSAGVPLSGATVRLYNSSSIQVASTATNAKGIYSFRISTSGQYAVTASKGSVASLSVSVDMLDLPVGGSYERGGDTGNKGGVDLTLEVNDEWDPGDDTASGGTWLAPATAVQIHGQHTLSSTDLCDFFRISMTAGWTYVFETTGADDTYGELYKSTTADSSGRVVYNDDGGDGGNFKLTYTPSSSGTYYLRVRQYSGQNDSYFLKYSCSSPQPATYLKVEGCYPHAYNTLPSDAVDLADARVDCDGVWSVSLDDTSWGATLKTTGGSGDGWFYFSVPQNTGYNRRCVFTVSSGSFVAYKHVTQYGPLGERPTGVKVTFGKNGGTGGSDSVSAVSGQAMPAASAPTLSGWTFGGGKAGATDVRSNGGPFDGGLSDYQTPYGSKYVQVRSKGGYIQRKFRVPETGEWHILFEYANRYNNDPDGLLTWGVYIDGEPLREKANDGLGNHGFITYHSPALSLEAGVDYTFRFETGENIDQSYGYDSMLVDGVRFARSDVVVNTGSFTKQGQGTLVVPFLDKPGTVNVQAGRLEADGLFESNTVNVASGATFAFRSPWEVYVPNASFEDDATDLTGVDRGFSYSCRISGWTLVGGSSYRVVPGWLENGSMASQSGPYTTNGTHAAYLRPSCSISAPVYVSRAGSYELSFEHVSRWGAENDSVSKGRMLTITATIDGNTVVVVPPRDYVAQPPFVRVSGTVALSAGCHELKIETDDANGTLPLENTSITSGTMVFIDNVRLVGEPVGFPDLGATWNFASGATVDVGDADIVLDKVYVNGVRIRGGTGAFRAAGLNVLGTGSFRSGPPSGFRVFFK